MDSVTNTQENQEPEQQQEGKQQPLEQENIVEQVKNEILSTIDKVGEELHEKVDVVGEEVREEVNDFKSELENLQAIGESVMKEINDVKEVINEGLQSMIDVIKESEESNNSNEIENNNEEIKDLVSAVEESVSEKVKELNQEMTQEIEKTMDEINESMKDITKEDEDTNQQNTNETENQNETNENENQNENENENQESNPGSSSKTGKRYKPHPKYTESLTFRGNTVKRVRKNKLNFQVELREQIKNEFDESPSQYLERVNEDEDLEELGQVMGKKTDFASAVLDAYLSLYSFDGMEISNALRKFLSGFVLPVEAQQIDRIMERFSSYYHKGNPNVFAHPDTAYILSFSLIMLNTDLHNPSVKNKMTKQEFIKNNRGIDQGKDLPKTLLESLYDNIKEEEFKYPGRRRGVRESIDGSSSGELGSPNSPSSSLWERFQSKFKNFSKEKEKEKEKENRDSKESSKEAPSPKESKLSREKSKEKLISKELFDGVFHPFELTTKMTRSMKKCPTAPGNLSHYFLPIANVSEINNIETYRKSLHPLRRCTSLSCAEYRSKPLYKTSIREGVLLKKNDVEDNDKKAKVRAWRATYVVLKASHLYCYSGDIEFNSKEVSLENLRMEIATPLKDVLAFKEDNNVKRQNVFRIITSTSQSFQIQTSTASEMNQWIHAINHLASLCVDVGFAQGILSKDKKIAILKQRLEFLQKKIDIESAYKAGIDKLFEQYRGKNRTAYTNVYDQFVKWETKMQTLQEQKKRFVCYLSHLGGMSQEEFLGLVYRPPVL